MKKKDTNSYIYVLIEKENDKFYDTWGYYTKLDSAMADKKKLEDFYSELDDHEWEVKVIECWGEPLYVQELKGMAKPQRKRRFWKRI